LWASPKAAGRLLGRTRRAAGFEGKVAVHLGPYKDGAISITQVPSPDVSDAAVDSALAKKKAKKTKFERINFTGSGARMGLTVVIEMEAKYAGSHPKAGLPIPGTKMKRFELELKEDQPEPWRQFVAAIVEKGMGQMEQKTFPVSFPEDYRKADFAGLTVDFTVLVKEIGETRPIEPDMRPDSEQRLEMASQLRAQAQKRCQEAIDAQLKEQLLQSSSADTELKTKSVSWAKFGPESEKSLKWNCILEEVARVEDIPFADVLPFLRREAVVQFA
jgi:FKBP-type peptidyl-prolyl cis-trans isomerase (trigger factor)